MRGGSENGWDFLMIYRSLDDLECLKQRESSCNLLTLVSVVRNEMYFLPAFLDHYRKLGVEHFAILDDQSDDGTREFLLSQPDCSVYESKWRFGDKPFSGRTDPPFADIRMAQVWRSLLLDRHCMGTWGLCVDADEFIRLPAGRSLKDVIAKAKKSDAQAIASVMIDLYPRSIEDIQAPSVFEPTADWFFDGLPHLALSSNPEKLNRPIRLYCGARERLIERFFPVPPSVESVLRKVLGRPLPKRYIEIVKVSVMRWREGCFFTNSHWPQLKVSDSLLLPLTHYKFTCDLYRRTQQAINSGAYWRSSAEYRKLAQLLKKMAASKALFLCKSSLPSDDFEEFVRTGNCCL